MIKISLTSICIYITILLHAQTSMDVHPSAFCDSAIISFHVAAHDSVTLGIYDQLGRAIKSFYSAAVFDSGLYHVTLYADSFVAGTYIVRYLDDTSQVLKKIVRTSCVTGITNPDTLLLLFYPNPTTGILHIPIEGMKNITITDALGRIVQTLRTTEKVTSLSGLADGVYILTVSDENNNVVINMRVVKGQ